MSVHLLRADLAYATSSFQEYLVSELGLGTVNLMRTVKNAIDPLGIMNPGKVCLHTFKLLAAACLLH